MNNKITNVDRKIIEVTCWVRTQEKDLKFGQIKCKGETDTIKSKKKKNQKAEILQSVYFFFFFFRESGTESSTGIGCLCCQRKRINKNEWKFNVVRIDVLNSQLYF